MPVIGLPTTLSMLRQALIDRVYLDATDPRVATSNLNAIINEAICRYDVAQPTGWPWDFQLLTQTLSAGSGSPLLLPPATTVNKLAWIMLENTAQTWEFPLERLSREEQLERYPMDNQTGVPKSYALMGADGATEPQMACYFRPLPDVDYLITIGGFRCIPDLVNDGDPDPTVNDFQIDDWNMCILEYAAHLLYRATDDLSEAVSANLDFNAQLLEDRKGARRTYGAGVPNRPMSTRPELL